MTIWQANDWTKYTGSWPWPNFSPREMADRDDGSLLIDTEFMDWLQRLRQIYGRPMVISSGYRTPLHQFLISGRYTGAHVEGMAVDVKVYGMHAHQLQGAAYEIGVLGVGVHQKGAFRKRYIHLDRWANAPDGLRPTTWSY